MNWTKKEVRPIPPLNSQYFSFCSQCSGFRSSAAQRRARSLLSSKASVCHRKHSSAEANAAAAIRAFFFGLLVGWAFRLLGLFFLAIFWGPGFTGTLRAAEGLKEGTGRGASDMGDTAEVAGWAYRCRKRWLSMWQSAKVKPIPVPKWHPQLNHLLGICEGLCNTPCIRLIKIGIVAQNRGETLGNNSKLRK